MRKMFMVLIFAFAFLFSSVHADALKNSLSNILNEKEKTPPVVNIGEIDLNAKPKPAKQAIKQRSAKAVIATVNSHKILKKEADDYLKKVTRGKITNIDHLPKKQHLRLVKEMAVPMLALDSAQKELSEEEKQAVYARTWMQKKASKIEVTDKEAEEVYNQLKQESKENNASATIPDFANVKNKIKSQILEKKILSELMKDVDIKVL